MAVIRARLGEAARILGRELRAVDPSLDDGSLSVMATSLYLRQYRSAHEAVLRDFPVGAAVLDWGAGIGHFAFVQQHLGQRVTAYTLTPTDYNRFNSVLRVLGGRAGFEVVEGTDPVRLPFADASFDVVVSCGVLEHVREFGGSETASLQEVARVLRPGGRFYCLHLPNRWSWIERVNRARGSTHHAHTYGRGDIRTFSAAAGLRVREHTTYGLLPKIQPAARLGRLADSRAVVGAWYAADALLGLVARGIAQNHFFVLEKPDPAGLPGVRERVPLRQLTALGAGIGLFISGVALAAWFARTRKVPIYTTMWSDWMLLRFALEQSVVLLGWYAAIGAVLGAWLWTSRPRRRRALAGILGAWGMLLALSVVAAPASWRLVPGLRALPIGVTAAVGIVLAAILLAGAAGRSTILVGGSAAWAAVMWWPGSGLRIAAAPETTAPSVFLLGVDALGRSGLDSVVALVRRDAPRALEGGRYYRAVISTTPLTRVAWLGMLGGHDPTDEGETQFVSTRSQQEIERVLGPGLPGGLRARGYDTAFLTDNAATSWFEPDAWFGEARVGSPGWQFGIRSALIQGLPLPQLLLLRFGGVGLSTAPEGGLPYRVWNAGFRIRGRSDSQPVFVASHTVVLNSPLNLAWWELERLGDYLALRPAAFLPAGTAGEAARRARLGATGLDHHDIYDLRFGSTVDATARLLAELDRRGYRDRALVVVVSDHGENFHEFAGGVAVSQGRHGLSLAPATLSVSVLVLPPRTGGIPPLAVDDTTLLPLWQVPALTFAALDGREAPAGDRFLTLASGANVLPTGDVVGDSAPAGYDRIALAREIRFLPGGRYLAPDSVVRKLDAVRVTGITDGRSVVSIIPLADGRFIVSETLASGSEVSHGAFGNHREALCATIVMFSLPCGALERHRTEGDPYAAGEPHSSDRSTQRMP